MSEFVATAVSLQKNLRFTTIGTFAHSASMGILYANGLINTITMVIIICCSIWISISYYRLFGSIEKWWWLKPGPILSSSDPNRYKESLEWLNEMLPARYAEVNPRCIKFFNKSDAVAYKLVWG